MKKHKLIISMVVIFTTLYYCSEEDSSPTEGENNNIRDVISTGVVDIEFDNNKLWFGTGNGLWSTEDGGITLISYSGKQGLPKGSISAIHISENHIFVAGAIDSQMTDGELLPAGTGLSYSSDKGETWTHISQPLDDENEINYNPTTSVIQNLIYDITFHDNKIWIASFAGGLRSSPDFGVSWQVITTDNIPFNPVENLNHRVFSVISFQNKIWVGTAEGISRSSDGGNTWTIFNHQNQNNPISGNFVVALISQDINSTPIIWASTIEAAGFNEFRAISKTCDFGGSWSIYLKEKFTHNFEVNNNYLWAATDSSVFFSSDFGAKWQRYNGFIDSTKGIRISNPESYSVCYVSDSSNANYGLWIGCPQGIAHSVDTGIKWDIIEIETSKKQILSLRIENQFKKELNRLLQ